MRTRNGCKNRRLAMPNAQTKFDVLVIGGGPAGMAAATRAAEAGASVAIVDDNARLGGQIWRSSPTEETNKSRPTEATKWQARVQAAKVKTFSGMRVFHQPGPGVLHAESADSLHELRFE